MRYALGLEDAAVKFPVIVVGVDEKAKAVGYVVGSWHGGLLLLPVHMISSMANLPWSLAVNCLISKSKIPVTPTVKLADWATLELAVIVEPYCTPFIKRPNVGILPAAVKALAYLNDTSVQPFGIPVQVRIPVVFLMII